MCSLTEINSVELLKMLDCMANIKFPISNFWSSNPLKNQYQCLMELIQKKEKKVWNLPKGGGGPTPNPKWPTDSKPSSVQPYRI